MTFWRWARGSWAKDVDVDVDVGFRCWEARREASRAEAVGGEEAENKRRREEE
jgi:hypothetical protein